MQTGLIDEKTIQFYFISEKYFDMNKKLARDALDLYKKFLIRMDRVAEFLKVAEVNFELIWRTWAITKTQSVANLIKPLRL